MFVLHSDLRSLDVIDHGAVALFIRWRFFFPWLAVRAFSMSHDSLAVYLFDLLLLRFTKAFFCFALLVVVSWCVLWVLCCLSGLVYWFWQAYIKILGSLNLLLLVIFGLSALPGCVLTGHELVKPRYAAALSDDDPLFPLTTALVFTLLVGTVLFRALFRRSRSCI